jgi:CRISPR-associated protein Csm4
MRIYKLTIRPLTSFRTLLQSDTIFGHLMWALRYLEGEPALESFLQRYRDGDPPLLVSAGFPSGTLPVPVLPPRSQASGAEEADLADRVVGSMLRRSLEADDYLPLPQWRELAQAMSSETLHRLRREARAALRELRQTAERQAVTRTAVDRITGSAREGQLFVSDEMFYAPGRTFDVWHKLEEDGGKLLDRLTAWWRWIERNGFGGGKSTGHGALRIEGEGLAEAGTELPQVEAPNGFVTLSAWVPAQDDPMDVTYRTRIKRGKLGESLTSPSPWKKPLLMLEPGAAAHLGRTETVRAWYGRVVEDMHWVGESVPETQRDAVEGVVQYGHAFPLPVHFRESHNG